MNTDSGHKIETILGVGLLILAVLGFLVSLILHLPKNATAQATAKPLQNFNRDIFTNDPTVQKVKGLNLPGGVPVTTDRNNVGRGNVFQNY